MFKKPNRKGQMRKKRKLEAPPEDDDDGEDAGDVLAGMRELQRQRERGRGLNPVTAEEREREAARKQQQAAIDEESKSKEQQGGLLNSFFEKTSEKSAMDKQMEDYVERNMKLLKGEDPDAQEEAPKTDEDRLFETPAELAPATSAVRDSELSGVSDIKEVEIGIEEKLKNIERTELARQKAEEERRQKAAGGGGPDVGELMSIPRNFNVRCPPSCLCTCSGFAQEEH